MWVRRTFHPGCRVDGRCWTWLGQHGQQKEARAASPRVVGEALWPAILS